jgi:cytosine/adenosine deaminase-related metal-dependent hydrolase
LLPSPSSIDAKGALLAPSLCHPHVHLDKAYLLSHPKYSHLQIERGNFSEAMDLTGKAKAKFEGWDLLERGQRVIDESVVAGVTHMRAFVEVDAGVGTKCLNAGLTLKQRAEDSGKCVVQLCAFAQLPLFSESPNDRYGVVIRGVMQEAGAAGFVDVVGSTPYVESDREKMERNVEWMVDLSIEHNVHLDFHLDYNLDPETEPLVWHVIKTLKEKKWNEKTTDRTIVLGHCTRLTLFSNDEWKHLKKEIGDLPISFVGLPTSDLFMMRTDTRVRGTLDVPTLIKEYGVNACIGINNIGNAFTPHGSCDPLTLACNGVGVYQAGTAKDAELLYECVSTRARAAIGVGTALGKSESNDEKSSSLQLRTGDDAGLLLFGAEEHSWRTRRSIAEVVYLYDHARNRKGYLEAVRS